MYYTTPESTTGKTPTEMLFGKTIRDKIPTLNEKCSFEFDDEVRDLDLFNKTKGKEREDSNRRSLKSNIEIGDKVLMKNVIIRNKLTPTFGCTEFTVTSKSGSQVTLIDDDGRQFKRNVSHVKKIPETFQVLPFIDPEPTCGTANQNNQTAIEIETPGTNQLYNEENLEQQEQSNQPEGEAQPKLKKLKLIKKGEMWHPVNPGFE
jgi:hypothetical protein